MFILLYFLSLISLLSTSDFFLFWVLIEIRMLLFIGFCFRSFTTGYSSLVLYFLIQTLSSFSLFVFYFSNLTFFMSFFLALKLSLFPFHFWFLSVIYKFSNFALFLSCSLHKLPSFLLFFLFSSSFSLSSVLLLGLISIFVASSVILSTTDLRFFLLASSVGNNVWFLLSSLHSFLLLISFLAVYSIIFISLVNCLSSTLFFFSTQRSTSSILVFSFLLVVLSGFPPFPIFFAKLLIVLNTITCLSLSFLITFMAMSSLLIAGYFRFLLSFYVYRLSSFLFYLH